jgi:hypothetical protein
MVWLAAPQLFNRSLQLSESVKGFCVEVDSTDSRSSLALRNRPPLLKRATSRRPLIWKNSCTSIYEK